MFVWNPPVRGWGRGLVGEFLSRLSTCVSLDECGIVAQISEPLAAADIPAYYISTFKFDHALVSGPWGRVGTMWVGSK